MNTRRTNLTACPTPVARYTPAPARRLATLTRVLWAEMIGLVDRLLKLATKHDPDGLSAERMMLRTLQIVLRGFSTEHRLWARLRQQGANRDDDNSLFRFLDEVHEIMNSRLASLEAEVATVAQGTYGGGPPEQHFGPGFCEALILLRAAYTDWSTNARQLDSIDSTEAMTPDEFEARNREFAAIEARARARRQGSPNPTRAAAKKTIRRGKTQR